MQFLFRLLLVFLLVVRNAVSAEQPTTHKRDKKLLCDHHCRRRLNRPSTVKLEGEFQKQNDNLQVIDFLKMRSCSSSTSVPFFVSICTRDEGIKMGGTIRNVFRLLYSLLGYTLTAIHDLRSKSQMDRMNPASNWVSKLQAAEVVWMFDLLDDESGRSP